MPRAPTLGIFVGVAAITLGLFGLAGFVLPALFPNTFPAGVIGLNTALFFLFAIIIVGALFNLVFKIQRGTPVEDFLIALVPIAIIVGFFALFPGLVPEAVKSAIGPALIEIGQQVQQTMNIGPIIP